MKLRLAACVFACPAVLLLGASPAFALNDVVVVKTAVTAARGDTGAFTATVDVVNNGDAETLVKEDFLVVPDSCAVGLEGDPALPERQGTSVKLTLDRSCLDAKTESQVTVDLDGQAGAMPVVTVKSPDPAVPPWRALVVGAASWLVALLVFCGWSWRIHERVKKNKVPDDGNDRRTRHGKARWGAYNEVMRLVDDRWEQVTTPSQGSLDWVVLAPRDYGASARVNNLEATWSLKDSWMTNVTALVSAVVALGSSDQLFTALNEDKPKGPMAVLMLAGLIGVALVAASNTVVKLIGKTANEVTVKGLVISTAALFAAAVFETVAVAIAAGYAVNAWTGFPVSLTRAAGLICAAGVVLVVLSWWYLKERLEQTLSAGVPTSGVPAIDMADFATWTLPAAPTGQEHDARPEKRELLAQRIRTALGPWLLKQATTRIGVPWSGTGASSGEGEWGPAGEVRKKVRPEPVQPDPPAPATPAGPGEEVRELMDPGTADEAERFDRRGQQQQAARPLKMISAAF